MLICLIICSEKISGDAQFQKQSVVSKDLGITATSVHKLENDIQNKSITKFNNMLICLIIC